MLAYVHLYNDYMLISTLCVLQFFVNEYAASQKSKCFMS